MLKFEGLGFKGELYSLENTVYYIRKRYELDKTKLELRNLNFFTFKHQQLQIFCIKLYLISTLKSYLQYLQVWKMKFAWIRSYIPSNKRLDLRLSIYPKHIFETPSLNDTFHINISNLNINYRSCKKIKANFWKKADFLF